MTQPVMTHDVGSVSAKLAEQGLEADARVLTRLEKRQRSLAELRDFAYTREAADARRAAEDAETRKDLAALADSEAFHERLREALDRANTRLGPIEQVRRFIIANEAFTTENGLMTPSLKIRRHLIKEIYGARLEGLYGRARS